MASQPADTAVLADLSVDCLSSLKDVNLHGLKRNVASLKPIKSRFESAARIAFDLKCKMAIEEGKDNSKALILSINSSLLAFAAMFMILQ